MGKPKHTHSRPKSPSIWKRAGVVAAVALAIATSLAVLIDIPSAIDKSIQLLERFREKRCVRLVSQRDQDCRTAECRHVGTVPQQRPTLTVSFTSKPNRRTIKVGVFAKKSDDDPRARIESKGFVKGSDRNYYATAGWLYPDELIRLQASDYIDSCWCKRGIPLDMSEMGMPTGTREEAPLEGGSRQ